VVDTKIAPLTAALESGAASAPVVAQLQARQAERESRLAAIAAADAVVFRNSIAIDSDEFRIDGGGQSPALRVHRL
jgi:hypothetical protein